MDGKYSIGDVAKIIGVESHTVRFWSTEMSERIRPTIGKGGRRYYTDSDVKFLGEIKDLIYNKGYTIGMLKKGLPFEKTQNSEIPGDFKDTISVIKNKISYLLSLYEENM